MERGQRSDDRSDHASDRSDQEGSRFASTDCVSLERGGHSGHGAGAVPRSVSVLRRGRQAVVPAVSAQLRHVPRGPVQHRVLRTVDDDGRRSVRSGAR